MADDSDEEPRHLTGKIHQNQPYDEAVEIPDSEEVASQYTPTPRVEIRKDLGRGDSSGTRQTQIMSDEESDDDVQIGAPPPASIPPSQGNPKLSQMPAKSQKPARDDDDSGGTGGSTDQDDDDDDDDDDDENGGIVEGAYNPTDYEHLAVTPEIKELFQYITRYTPQSIELEYRLKPFIPDFIPAVGDIDAFIKIPRHDNKPDTLGLTVLDEPCAKQSDPTVLDLMLRSLTKQSNLKEVTVKSIENTDNSKKAIDNWIKSISDLHRTKPPPNVHYAKNMPDIDTLMQEWPPEVEELLKELTLPSAEMECDLPQYVDLITAIVDIPVHKSRVQSLHLLFSLYSEFKNSQHFQALASDKPPNSYGGGAIIEDDSDRLTL